MLILLRQVKIIEPRSPHHNQTLDVLLREGEVEAIGKKLEAEGAQIIEEEGLHLSPGWVDIGMQIADPGLEHREDMDSAMESAARGGYTAIAPFPNTEPVIHSKAALNYWNNRSRGKLVDLLPIGAMTLNCKGQEITEMIDMQRAGAIGFSDGSHSTQHNGMMLRALQYVKAFRGVVINQPFDATISGGGHLHEGLVSTHLGIKGISNLAEELMVMRDINLAEYTESRVHIHGISSAGSVALIRAAKERGLAVTCSVPGLNLVFEDEQLLGFDALFKVMPPLREGADRQALIQGLQDGTIDMIISNHVPLEEEKKKLEFAYADCGAIGLETNYALLNTHLDLDPALLVEKLALDPRRVFGLPDAGIETGQTADLTLFHPDKGWQVDKARLASKSENTPLHGHKLKGQVRAVFHNRQSQFFNYR